MLKQLSDDMRVSSSSVKMSNSINIESKSSMEISEDI